MRFPEELWQDPTERRLLADLLALFPSDPVVLTDRLTNSVYFSPAAEALFAAEGDAITNRVAASLLGFGARESAPKALDAALLGESAPWRAAVEPFGEGPVGTRVVCEASAVRGPRGFVAGLLRFPGSVQ